MMMLMLTKDMPDAATLEYRYQASILRTVARYPGARDDRETSASSAAENGEPARLGLWAKMRRSHWRQWLVNG